MTKHRTQRVSRLRRRKTLRRRGGNKDGKPPKKPLWDRSQPTAFGTRLAEAAKKGETVFGLSTITDKAGNVRLDRDSLGEQEASPAPLVSRRDAAAEAAANAELAAADKALEEANEAAAKAEAELAKLLAAARGPGKAAQDSLAEKEAKLAALQATRKSLETEVAEAAKLTAEKEAAKAAAKLPQGWTRNGPDVENDVWYEFSEGDIQKSQFSNPNYPDMPPYWVEQQDAKTGEVWFANKNTKASQWERPKAGGKRRRIRGGEKPSIPHVQVPKPSGQPPPPTPGGRRR